MELRLNILDVSTSRVTFGFAKFGNHKTFKCFLNHAKIRTTYYIREILYDISYLSKLISIYDYNHTDIYFASRSE